MRGDAIPLLDPWGSSSASDSGSWWVNGIVQGAGHAITAAAAELSTTTFKTGSGADLLWVRARDGIDLVAVRRRRRPAVAEEEADVTDDAVADLEEADLEEAGEVDE